MPFNLNESCVLGAAFEQWLPIVKENHVTSFDAVNSEVVSAFAKYFKSEIGAEDCIAYISLKCLDILSDVSICSRLCNIFRESLSCVSECVTTSTRSSLMTSSNKTPSSKGKSTSFSLSNLKTAKEKPVAVSNDIPTYPITIEISKNFKVNRAMLRTLAQKTADAFTSIEVNKYYQYCPTVGCNKCSVLYNNVHLTKCNHQSGKKCNNLGLYPHLSRSVWKQLHACSNYLPALVCFSKHFLNPRANKIQGEDQAIRTQEQMVTENNECISTRLSSINEQSRPERTHEMVLRSKAQCDNAIVKSKQQKNEEYMNILEQKLAYLSTPSIRSRSELSMATGSTVPGGQCPCGAKLVRSRKGAKDLVCSVYKASQECKEWENIIQCD